MKKLTKADCKKIGVYNAHNFAAHGVPFVDYMAADHGRLTAHYAYWAVNRPGYKVDPTNWHYGFCKDFTINCRENKEPVLAEALAWAGARYKITEWVKTPFGSYMDAGYVKTRLEELQQKLAELPK